jgi:hypothetical protein
MANPIDRNRRWTVRTALVTGSTLAALIGAQALATLDTRTAAAAAVSAPTTVQANSQQESHIQTLGDDNDWFYAPDNSSSQGVQSSITLSSARASTHSSQ